jgi:hypothetical protein
VARGIHHFMTSSGQKTRDNFVAGSSARIFGTESGGIGSRALAAARLFGAFHRLEAALVFLGAFVILANAPQGSTFRPADSSGPVTSDVGIHSTLRSTVPTLLQSPAVVQGAPVAERLGRAPA